MSMLSFQWPQLIWLAWSFLLMGIAAAKNGQLLRVEASIWITLIRVCGMAILLWSGGFFTPAHAQVPASSARYRAELTRAAHAQWGLNAPIAVLAAQVHQESGWRPEAVSQVGARGLAQFMPGTASWWCQRDGTATAACLPHNPTWALRALVGYDKYLYDLTPARYSPQDRMWVALRGYNGGLGHWQKEAASLGLAQPTRAQVDAACGKARRAAVHCKENLGYPQRILLVLQPRYALWGPGL